VKVAVETIDPCKKKLVIEVPEEDVNKQYRATVNELKKEATMPGFRKGRIPYNLLRTRFKKQIEGEVKARLLQTSYEEALKETNLSPILRPEVDQDKLTVAENQPFKYEVTIEVKPEIQVEGYKGMAVKKLPVKPVTDEDVQKGLEALQREHIQYREAPEGYSIKGNDLIVIDYDGFLEDKPIKNGSVQDYSLVVGSKTMIPGFEEQFLGRQKGDQFEFNLTYPEDHPNEELAGKNVRFSVKIKDVKEGYLLPLDDEFAKDLEFNSLEELKGKIRQGIAERLQKEVDAALKRQILNALVEKHPFPVPPSLVNYQRIMFRIPEEEAVRRVRSSLILEEIARLENITVSEEELDEEIKKMAARHNQHPAALKKSLKEKGSLEDVRLDLLETKTLDFLVSHANILEENKQNE